MNNLPYKFVRGEEGLPQVKRLKDGRVLDVNSTVTELNNLEQENARLKEALKYLTDLDMNQVHSLIRQNIKEASK